jgi:hypothetical protein
MLFCVVGVQEEEDSYFHPACVLCSQCGELLVDLRCFVDVGWVGIPAVWWRLPCLPARLFKGGVDGCDFLSGPCRRSVVKTTRANASFVDGTGQTTEGRGE